MSQATPNTRQIARDGQRLLDSLQDQLGEEDYGRFVAIDVDSGEYFVGESAIDATNKARAKHPDKVFFLGRVGCRTAYTFKGRR